MPGGDRSRCGSSDVGSDAALIRTTLGAIGYASMSFSPAHVANAAARVGEVVLVIRHVALRQFAESLRRSVLSFGFVRDAGGRAPCPGRSRAGDLGLCLTLGDRPGAHP